MSGATAEKRNRRSGGLKWYTMGPLAGAAATALLVFGCALLLEREVFPASTLAVLTLACVFAGSAVGGLVSAKRRGRGALESGGLCGLCLAALIVTAALIAPGSGPAAAACLRFVLAAAAGGLFGGALGMDRGRSKHRRATRRK